MEIQEFETVVQADRTSFSLKELIKYKDLIFTFVNRNFTLLYKQTILGPAWILIAPLITSVIFGFVFGGLAGIETGGVPQFLFYFAGNSLWTYFSSIFIGVSNTFIHNAGIFGKVYFPRLIIPISQIATSGINFLVQMLLFSLTYIYYYLTGANISINIWALYLPILVIQVGILALGVGVIVSSLTTRYRDLAILVTFGVQLWMYISPIVYPLSSIDGITETILLLNPMTMPVEIFRMALLNTGEFVLESFILSWVITIVSTLIGIKMFTKIERTFVDTI